MRWIGAVALFGLLAYLFTPLSAAGAEGAPVGFGINIRYVIPALLAGIVLLLPLATARPQTASPSVGCGGCWRCCSLVLRRHRPAPMRRCATRRASSPCCLVVLVVLVPALLLYLRSRGAGGRLVLGGRRRRSSLARWSRSATRSSATTWRPLRQRRDADERIPGMDLDSAYRWARGSEDARIGLAGTTAGFPGYGFYGTDLSNRVVYLGEDGPHGAFNAIPTCAAFRAAVNDADLDYLVTAPFLNFIHPATRSPRPRRAGCAARARSRRSARSGPVTVWRVEGELDPRRLRPRQRAAAPDPAARRRPDCRLAAAG